MKLKKSPPQEGNVGATGGSGNKCKITTQPSSTNGPSSDFDRTEAMLKWKKYTNGLLEKGYWVFDLLQDDDAASVNIHCDGIHSLEIACSTRMGGWPKLDSGRNSGSPSQNKEPQKLRKAY
jgi:hypothetical protein